MIKQVKSFIPFLFAAILLAACTNREVFPSEPSIEFLDISPRIVTEFVDTIVITLAFTDGNGDLGDDGNNTFNMFVTDNRSNIDIDKRTTAFILPNLTPDAKNPAIQGEIIITYPPTAIIDQRKDSVVTTFDILVVDRAGNESNTVTSTPITIVR